MTPGGTRDRIRESLALGSRTTAEVAQSVGLSRQAVHLHLRQMMAEGEVRHLGAPRGRSSRYELTYVARSTASLEGLEESDVWYQFATLPEVAQLPSNVLAVHQYVFTEMLNNAIDHSGGTTAVATLRHRHERTTFAIADDGVGVFARIDDALGVGNPPQAIAELSKGKLTTDPERHTGEGIFFSARAVDVFVIEANGWKWIVDNTVGDWAIAESQVVDGTRVEWGVDDASSVRLVDVFARYTEDYRFSSTATQVRMFDHGSTLISRSEARRVAARLESFDHVELDFDGVELIGQGFADELFRVWAEAHPDVTLHPSNMNQAVTFMVERAQRH